MELLDILAIVKICIVIWIAVLVFVLYQYLKKLVNKIPSLIFHDKKHFTIRAGHKQIRVKIK